MNAPVSPQKSIYQRAAEWFHVPRSARKAWVGGMADIAKGLIRVLTNTEGVPNPVKFVLTGILMGVLGIKSNLEGKPGDEKLGVHDPAAPGEKGLLPREPNAVANFITQGEWLARKGGAQMFLIQVGQILTYTAGLISNLPKLNPERANQAAWASKWILGPFLGIAETAEPLLTRAAQATGQGAFAGASGATVPGSGFTATDPLPA